MGEGQRIEGQMFRSAGVRWAAAIVALMIACGAVLVFGYFIKWWSGAAQNWAATIGGGGAGGLARPMALPAANVLPSSSVPWPVSAAAPFREHWEGRLAGVTTLFAGYWKAASNAGWEHVWGTGVILPIEGEDELVLVVQVPRDETPDAASEGMVWLCTVEENAAGDFVPVAMDIRLMARLEGAWVRRMWERGLPEGLVVDLVKRAHAVGRGPRVWQGSIAEVSEFFKDVDDGAEECTEEEAAEPESP